MSASIFKSPALFWRFGIAGEGCLELRTTGTDNGTSVVEAGRFILRNGRKPVAYLGGKGNNETRI